MSVTNRERLILVMVALVGAFFITRYFVAGPGYTDVFYHLNAANRLVTGQGLTDPYYWTYIGATDKLPAPSHLYWMPLTSLSAAVGMWLLNAPNSYTAAQLLFSLMFAGLVLVGFWCGAYLGGTRRHMWVSGLITLFSGIFVRYWGAIDTFAPYALAGSLSLVFLGLSNRAEVRPQRTLIYAVLGGAFAGFAHLTRADGVLLVLVGWAALGWSLLFNRSDQRMGLGRLISQGVALTLGYLVVMLPWFIRNLNVLGTPMPLGGTQTIWFTSYDDLFNYPPLSTPATLFANGIGEFVASRWLALTNNLGTFVAVEGLIVMTPLMLIGFWGRRRTEFLQPFWIYVVGLHLAMTFVFPFPGYRGGLLHSAAALVPFWAALSVVGLDAVVDWVARRRRRWNARSAKTVFSIGLVAMAILLSLRIGLPNRVPPRDTSPFYQALGAQLPPAARVMINDPAQLYYFTGLGGVVLPNESPDVIVDIARKYGVKYVLIEEVSDDGRSSNAITEKMVSILTAPPDFLVPMPFNVPNVRLYEIRY
ncbi:MAG: hypothetical protein GC179_14595 [Anaerolineaceae bacterium]|nr:hypothetical protein [Anaerolineaceae bacterium]